MGVRVYETVAVAGYWPFAPLFKSLPPATCVCSFVSFSLIFLVPSNVHHELARLRRQTTGGFRFHQPRRNYWRRWSFVGQVDQLQRYAHRADNIRHPLQLARTLSVEWHHVSRHQIHLSSGTDRVLRAKKNKTGLHCIKTEKAIVVSIYEEPTTPQQAA